MQRATVISPNGVLSPWAQPVYVTLEFFIGLDEQSVLIYGVQDEYIGDCSFIEEALFNEAYAVDDYTPWTSLRLCDSPLGFITLRGRLGWTSDIYRDHREPGVCQQIKACNQLAFWRSSVEYRPLSDIIDNHRWAGHIAWLDRMRRELA